MNADDLPRVKAACCRLESSAGLGTGYLVGELRIATCWHVVKGLAPGSVVKAQFGASTAPRVAAKVAAVEREADCALLELAEPLPGVEPLGLRAGAPLRAECLAYGFPAFADAIGVVLHGTITDNDAEIPGGLRGVAVFSPMLGSHPPASMGGLSGSPLLVGGAVAGHFSSVLGSEDAMKQPHLGYGYAVPSAGMLSLLGGSRPAPESVPATPPANILRLNTAFNRLRVAYSGAEVHECLAEERRRGTLTPELELYAAEVLLGLMLPDDALSLLVGRSEPRALELQALALSLKGRHAEAQALAATLSVSAESLGIKGGILKRRWLAKRDETLLRSAFTTYFEAYSLFGDHYPGVNAAACALYLGEHERSRSIAQEIAGTLAKKPKRDAWEQASLAEAYLLSGALDPAREQYAAATEAHAGKARDLAVLRAQALRNVRALGVDENALAAVLPRTPGIAAFTGHRIGANFPAQNAASVRERLADVLREQQVKFAFCSAASGSDLLFIEILLDHHVDVEVFLPFPIVDFKRTSVGPDEHWLDCFDTLMTRLGHRVTVLSTEAPARDDPKPYVRCNEAIHAAARKKAEPLHASPFLLAVVAAAAETEKPAPGGAAHAVQAWLARGGGDVVKIDPS
jgi:hypothetical protein